MINQLKEEIRNSSELNTTAEIENYARNAFEPWGKIKYELKYSFDKNIHFVHQIDKVGTYNFNDHITMRLPEGKKIEDITKIIEIHWSDVGTISQRKVKVIWNDLKIEDKTVEDILLKKIAIDKFVSNVNSCAIDDILKQNKKKVIDLLSVKKVDDSGNSLEAKIQVALNWFAYEGANYVQILFKSYVKCSGTRAKGEVIIPVGENTVFSWVKNK